MISLIVARSKNNVIGKNGRIPWSIKGEQRQFRELTTGNVVIMGRKTYNEIGYPLRNRLNIIVSRTKTYSGENLVTARSLQEALEMAKNKDVYVAGGHELFAEAIPLVDRMYITEIDLDVKDGDVFFPEFDPNEFDMSVIETNEDDVRYVRTVYVRKDKKTGGTT